MKMRVTCLAVVLVLAAAGFGDEVSDALAKAQKLVEAKKYVEAKAEIERALALVTPLAKAQTRAPEVKDRVYINYEYNFRATCPEKDWVLSILKTTSPGPTYTLCSVALVKDGKVSGDMVLFYLQDLREKFGGAFKPLAGAEALAYLKKAGNEAGASTKILSTLKNTAQSELTVAGLDAVRTDYAGVSGGKAMKCFTLHFLRDHCLFTGIFIGLDADDAEVAPAFKQIIDSVDLAPAPGASATPK